MLRYAYGFFGQIMQSAACAHFIHSIKDATAGFLCPMIESNRTNFCSLRWLWTASTTEIYDARR
jgi:hypothetical protein